MKLTTTTFLSVDGVMQGVGGPDEDRSGGFERGGWTTTLFDKDTMKVMDGIFQRADAFLFGRRTYVMFADSWGTMPDPGGSAVWGALHAPTEVRGVVHADRSAVGEDFVLSGDVAAAIRKLKAKPGRELQVHGSGRLVRWLLDNEGVDKMNLLTFPVVVGQGTRLFPDTGADRTTSWSNRVPPRSAWRSTSTGPPGARGVRNGHGRPEVREEIAVLVRESSVALLLIDVINHFDFPQGDAT